MRRTEPLRSFTERPGYGDECAVCPFCGKINDLNRIGETACYHFVRKTVDAGQEGALFASPSAQAEAATESTEAQEARGEVHP